MTTSATVSVTTPSLAAGSMSTRLIRVAALATAALLSACGGGADSATTAAPTAAPTAAAAVPAADLAQASALAVPSGAIGTAGAAVLGWKGSTAVVSYRVYYGTSSRAYLQPLGAGLPATSAAMTIYGLVSGQTYYFSVTGVDAGGKETAYSDEMTKVIS
jgi:hypothetical protein